MVHDSAEESLSFGSPRIICADEYTQLVDARDLRHYQIVVAEKQSDCAFTLATMCVPGFSLQLYLQCLMRFELRSLLGWGSDTGQLKLLDVSPRNSAGQKPED